MSIYRLYISLNMEGVETNTTSADPGLGQLTTPGGVTNQRGPITMEIFFVILAVLGMLGNGLVLFIFLKVPQLRVNTNILIANQSVVDFVSSVLLILIFIPPEVNLSGLDSTNHTLANFICKVWFSEYFYWASTAISTTNLVFITLERYLAVMLPHMYRERANKKITFIVCALAWLIGALTKAYFLFTRRVVDGDCTSRGLPQHKKHVIGYLTLMTTIVIPVGIMVFAYSSIFRALKPSKTTPDGDKFVQHSNHQLPTSSDDPASLSMQSVLSRSRYPEEVQKFDPKHQSQPKKQKSLSAKERARKNVLVTMFLVCVIYVVCWTPNQVLYFHHNVFFRHDWTEPFHRFTILLAASNICTNPIIYTLKYRSFQRGLRKVFVKDTTSLTGLSSV